VLHGQVRLTVANALSNACSISQQWILSPYLVGLACAQRKNGGIYNLLGVCLSIEFIVLQQQQQHSVNSTDFVFCVPMFHLLFCFLCIPCNANLSLTILVMVTPIVIVHFDTCILPKRIFDGSWGKWGERKF